ETQSAAVHALLSPLLRAFEMLAFIARHLHPPDIGNLMASIGAPEAAGRTATARQPAWPETLSSIAGALEAASAAALQAFAGLRAALGDGGDMRATYRALRLLPKGLEALYPLASILPPVNQFFLDPSLRSDQALQRLLLQAPVRDTTGVLHVGDDERGGFWLYVPEHYTPDRPWPLVAAPTSAQTTWALLGPDPDTPNLVGMLDFIRARWNVDPTRLLLTGMSDG